MKVYFSCLNSIINDYYLTLKIAKIFSESEIGITVNKCIIAKTF